VLKAIAHALNVPLAGLYERLGWLDDDDDDAQPSAGVEAAIEADERLTATHKRALRDMYRTLVGDVTNDA